MFMVTLFTPFIVPNDKLNKDMYMKKYFNCKQFFCWNIKF